MAFARPSLSTLVRWAQSDIESRLSGAAASVRRTFEFVMARVVAGAAHGLHGHLVWLSKQLFPDTAEDVFAERWAGIWGLERVAAVKASGTVDITGVNLTVCPDQTEWQDGTGQIYIQDGDVTIAGGVATITVDAQLAGVEGNQSVGAQLSLVTPVAGIDSTGTVSGSGLTGGADQETVDSLRSRLLERLQTPPKGGGPGDYVAWAKEVNGVTRAWEIANGDGLGTVVVYFARDDDLDPIPDSTEVQDVQDYLDTVAPITADVNVYAPTAVDLDLTIAATPDTAAVRTAIEAALEDYIIANGGANGVTFPLSQLDEAISLATGETSHVMSVPAAAPTYTVGQLPVLGTITWA